MNDDGTVENDSNVSSIDANPVEMDFVNYKISQDYLETGYVVDPHKQDCKCMKCFVNHKLKRYNKTCTNIFMVILFLVFIYIVYMLLLRMFM